MPLITLEYVPSNVSVVWGGLHAIRLELGCRGRNSEGGNEDDKYDDDQDEIQFYLRN